MWFGNVLAVGVRAAVVIFHTTCATVLVATIIYAIIDPQRMLLGPAWSVPAPPTGEEKGLVT